MRFNLRNTLTEPLLAYRFVSYRIVSYRIVSYRIISYRIVSYSIVSYRILSYPIVSYRIISYHIVSYRIVSYLIVSYRIILYRIVSTSTTNMQPRRKRAKYSHEVGTSVHNNAITSIPRSCLPFRNSQTASESAGRPVTQSTWLQTQSEDRQPIDKSSDQASKESASEQSESDKRFNQSSRQTPEITFRFFDLLGEELTHIVLRCLPQRDIAAVAACSYTMRQASMDPALWTELALLNAVVQASAWLVPQVQRKTVRLQTARCPSLLRRRRFSQLQRLCIHTDQFHEILEATRELPASILSLDVQYMPPEPREHVDLASWLLGVLLQLPRLQRLSLGGLDWYDLGDLWPRLAALCPDLTALSLERCYVTDKALVTLAHSCPGLQELFLLDNEAEDCSVRASFGARGLRALVRRCTQLRILRVRASFRLESSERLTDQLFEVPSSSLLALSLSGLREITGTGLLRMAENWHKLQELELALSQIRTHEVVAAVRALPALRMLRVAPHVLGESHFEYLHLTQAPATFLRAAK
eukprot:g8160.t1